MKDRIKVYADTELTHKAKLVYLYLLERVNRADSTCFPSFFTFIFDSNVCLCYL